MKSFARISNRYKGIIYIVLSAFSFSIMNACVKLAGDVPVMQKCFFRNSVAFAVAGFALLRSGKGLGVKREQLPYYAVRLIFGSMGVICNFYAIGALALPDASMLNKMSPFFAILFSRLWLKEKLTPVQVGAVAMAFVGSLFIIKPTFVGLEFLPALIGLLGGLAAGLAYTAVRRLGSLGANRTTIVFLFSAFSMLICVPSMIFAFQPMTAMQYIALFGAGIGGAGGQFAVTAAYSCAPAREISAFDYSIVIFASIWSLLLFSELPDMLSVIGYVIICGVAIVNMLWGHSGTRS